MKKITFILSIALTLSAFAQVPSYVPTNGLVGWWPFNGNANDESGNGNNGTVNGATLTEDRNGNFNSAFNFNYQNWTWGAGGDYIYIPFSSQFNTPNLTVSVWFNLSSLGYNNNGVTIINRFENGYSNPGGETWRLWYSSNDLLSSAVIQGGNGNMQPYITANGGSVNFNEWNNVTFTYDGLNLKQYENGILVGVVPSNGLLLNAAGNSGISVGISIQANGHWGPYDGKIDDIGIWNRALTPQEVTALYNGCQQSILTQPQSQSVNFNDNVQFTAASSDPNANYQWQTNLGLGFQNLTDAGQYSGSSTNTLNVSNVALSNNNQQFRCIVNSGSCTDTSDVALLTVVNNVGLVEQNQMQLFVYPNPTSSIITIENPQGLISNFVLVDARGREVLQGSLDSEFHSFEISHFTSGIYTIIFEQKSINEVKIIKE